MFHQFSIGDATLPAKGMQAIPAAIESRLAAGTIRLQTPVPSIVDGCCILESGETVKSECVVVATDVSEALRLVPDSNLPRRHSAISIYFDAPEPPIAEPILVLDGDGSGPVNNLCVVSEVAPEYAPADRALVVLSVPDLPGVEFNDNALLSDVLTQMEEWFGPVAREWKFLRSYRTEHGLPHDGEAEVGGVLRLALTCGSLHYAMLAGRHAAEEILGRSNE